MNPMPHADGKPLDWPGPGPLQHSHGWRQLPDRHARKDEGLRRICDTIRIMKTATIPSVRVEPDFRAEVEAVLADGETLSEFVEASVRAGVERRRVQGEFVARGLRSRDEARRTGDYVDADVVLDGLQRKLDAARVRLATKGK
jgi:hypothetical protein